MADLALVTRSQAGTTENPIEGDLRLVNGQLVLVDGLDAIAQHIQVRLRWSRGEWFTDTREGVPYFERILGQKGVDEAELRSIFRQAIEGTPGVEFLRSFSVSFDRQRREARVEFVATTVAGDVIASGADAFVVNIDGEVA